jgi:hypothetical protein
MVDVTGAVPFSHRLQLLHADKNVLGANVGSGKSECSPDDKAEGVSAGFETAAYNGTCKCKV